MEETKLEVECQEKIIDGLKNTKLIMEKQVLSFGRLFMGKVLEKYKSIDSTRLNELLLKDFTTPVCVEFDYLFQYYKNQELEFYNKNLKTADLIFNTLKDKRMQTIYLENIIKKMNEKEEDIQDVFTTSAKNKLNENDKQQHPSLNVVFTRFVQKLINTSHLPIEQSEQLYNLAVRYYNLFQMDVASALGQLFSGNKDLVISKIEEEMDIRQIRKGKRSAISEKETTILNKSLKIMEKMLENTINHQKRIAKEDLKDCSKSLVDLFFKILPEKYQDQRELIDIIIDTNINERLGKLLDKETEKLTFNLNYMNKDIIENELYEEKRYQKIEDYQCDLDLINVVYQDVLHEICIAYNIAEDDQNTKRLKVVLLSEAANSPKMIFNNYIMNVKKENRQNLNVITLEMHNQKEKDEKETVEINSITSKK